MTKVRYQMKGFEEPIEVTLSWVPCDDFGGYCWFVHAKHPVIGCSQRYVRNETNMYRAADKVVFDMVLERAYDTI